MKAGVWRYRRANFDALLYSSSVQITTTFAWTTWRQYRSRAQGNKLISWRTTLHLGHSPSGWNKPGSRRHFGRSFYRKKPPPPPPHPPTISGGEREPEDYSNEFKKSIMNETMGWGVSSEDDGFSLFYFYSCCCSGYSLERRHCAAVK